MQMAQNDYWLLREQNKAQLNAEKLNKQLEKVYKEAYKSINRQIEKVWLEMLSEGEITPSSIYKNNRLKSILDQVNEQLKKLGVYLNDNLQLNLLDTFESAYYESSKQLGGANISFSLVSAQLANEIVNASYKNATYSERIWNNLEAIRQQIEKTIVDTAITGQDVKKASRGLAERMGVSLNDAKRITITETDRVLQESCRQSAISRGYKSYHILVEPNACDECQADFTNKHFDINESVLPKHPFCRCCMIIDLD